MVAFQMAALRSQHSQLGCLWLPTPDCVAPV